MRSRALETLIYKKNEGIAYITLNRPQVLNALNARMVDELVSVWQDVRDDGEVQVVILTGSGPAFMQGRGDRAARARALKEGGAPPRQAGRTGIAGTRQ